MSALLQSIVRLEVRDIVAAVYGVQANPVVVRYMHSETARASPSKDDEPKLQSFEAVTLSVDEVNDARTSSKKSVKQRHLVK